MIVNSLYLQVNGSPLGMRLTYWSENSHFYLAMTVARIICLIYPDRL